MSAYEDKVEAKRERFAERARKKRAEASARFDSQKQRLDMIPMGQPILVGHHSERRHRRDLERIDRDMRKSVEATAEAERLERKAEGYGTHSVSSDDPEATAKLAEQLAKLEAKRDMMKAHNKKARKAGGDTFEPWQLTNLGANIRRLKKRIAELETAAVRTEAEPIEGPGFRIEESKGGNRIRFYFDKRPDKATCKKMKQAGFRWSPTAGAWQRNLNEGGIYAARRMAKELFGWEPEEGK